MVPLHQMFIATAKKYSNDIAIVDRNLRKNITYGRALIGALLLARRFRQYKDGYLGIMIPNSSGSILSILGTLFAGKVPVMINYSTGAAENSEFAQQKCNFHTIITSRALLEKLGCRLVPGMVFIEDIIDSVSAFEKILAAVKSKLPVFLLKHLVHKADNISSNIDTAHQAFAFKQQDRMLAILPYFHVFGHMANFWLPLSLGMRLVVYANPLDFKTIVRIIHEEKASLVFGTPFFLLGFLKQAKEGDFDSIRVMIASADKLPATLRDAYKEKHGIEIIEAYGATETSPVISANLPGANKPGSIGRVLPNIQVRITDVDTGKDLPAGEEGKILVKGDLVMKGYLNDLEETALKIKDGWYETGDMGMFDEDGFLWHRGRLKRFAKIGGEMVSLVRIESVLVNHIPEDKECCVVDVPDARKGAMITVAMTADLDTKELNQKLSKELPAISMPKRYFVFEELPKMGSGKIDFRTTTEMVKSALRKETEETEANKLAKKKSAENSPEDINSSDTETPYEG
jgi:acyl-[acyl-carrier-protein]-phospholipid O-acyltransferase/long-chain-fatty-acid--[acyl-carrier-protein] ligase